MTTNDKFEFLDSLKKQCKEYIDEKNETSLLYQYFEDYKTKTDIIKHPIFCCVKNKNA